MKRKINNVKIQDLTPPTKSKENIKKERFAGRSKLKEVFKNIENENKKERNKLIWRAFKDYGYTQIEIGNHLNIHYASISRIIKNEKKNK